MRGDDRHVHTKKILSPARHTCRGRPQAETFTQPWPPASILCVCLCPLWCPSLRAEKKLCVWMSV